MFALSVMVPTHLENRMEFIKSIARRILRDEVNAALAAAEIEGYLAAKGEEAKERRLAGAAAVAAWEAVVEAGVARLIAEKRRSSRNRLRAVA